MQDFEKSMEFALSLYNNCSPEAVYNLLSNHTQSLTFSELTDKLANELPTHQNQARHKHRDLMVRRQIFSSLGCLKRNGWIDSIGDRPKQWFAVN